MNSATFNGLDLSEYLIIKSIKESVLPPVSTVRRTIPGRIGSKYIEKTLGERIIEIDVEIQADSFNDRQDILDLIAPRLYTEEEKELTLRGKRKYYASIDSETPLDNLIYNGVTTLTFLATDPLAYGGTKIFGIGSPMQNNGTHKTTGTITVKITAPTSLLTVKLVGTDKKITLGHDFIANDTVVIDLEGEKVYKNTHSIMADCYIESDFFDIPTGEFNISVSSGSATLRFKERWL